MCAALLNKEPSYHRTWLTINLGAIKRNISAIRKILPKKTLYCAMVKADGYGHGAFQMAKTALEAGASYLGVASLDEAVSLRHAGIVAPIFVSGSICPSLSEQILQYSIEPTIYTLAQAQKLSYCLAKSQDEPLQKTQLYPIHVKVDTGMNRIGLDPCEVLPFIREIASLPNLHIQGLFTHFASADTKNLESAQQQLALFTKLLEELRAQNITIPLIHAANSAATLRIPASHFSMVRVGIAQYGLWPSSDVPQEITLERAMSMYTRVVYCKVLTKDEYISYGGSYLATKGSRIATLAAGYADGVPRILSNKAHVLIRGKKCPIVGTICMDQCMVDVSAYPEIQEGDVASLFSSSLPVEEMARLSETINYEIICGINKRVPRLYYAD